ncbi:hypothetical protein FGG08_006579 [Glutinoglossum americanum]|uniref:NB-ARC domain-containing protein n=1 Tax=Glutinoglossum americanum TaxID=1670608 RepID=A0A9P8HSD0_9PEZI|nr:hypothetical protein FGG08_006579 [Glutinoglossum americanum]
MSLFSKLRSRERGKDRVRIPEPFRDNGGSSMEVNGTSIVAVHGLGGDWERTWTDENGKLWLRDFLPSQLPSSRIMSYGYNSATAFSKATTDITDEAGMLLDRLSGERLNQQERTRPIIFVAHSLGGIVVKKASALILAHERSRHYADILGSVRGCVFLGVPHRGSDAAYWGTFAANLLKLAKPGININTKFLEALQRNSAVFAEISQQFVERGASLQIRTFYETEKLRSLLIVDRESARLGLPNELAVGIAGANHRTMCKYSSAASQKYLPVRRALESMVDLDFNSTISRSPALNTEGQCTKSSGDTREPNPSPPALVVIPFGVAGGFVGREDEMKEMERKLSDPNSNRCLALWGLGGVGKSRIALEYASRYRTKWPQDSVYWVHASNHRRVEQSYREIAKAACLQGTEDPKANILWLVKNWLRSKEAGRWLMVIDNADDPEVFFSDIRYVSEEASTTISGEKTVFDYVPQTPNGSVIYTTRNKAMGIKLTGIGSLVSIDTMSPSEAGTLLNSKLDGEAPNREEDVNQLLKELDYLPLAACQAAAFIRETSQTVSQYLQAYCESDLDKIELLNHEFRDLVRDPGASNAVLKTWMLSFNQIRRDDPRAADLMSVMSFFDRQRIPRYLLLKRSESAVRFAKALGTLKAFSFITSNQNDTMFDIHRLVHISTRNWLCLNHEQGKWAVQALILLSNHFPTGTREDWDICAELLPHAEATLRYDYPTDPNDNYRASLLHSVAGHLFEKGQYQEARRKASGGLTHREKTLGREHPETLKSMSLSAVVLQALGEYGAAEELIRRVLQTREKILGKDHPGTLESAHNLGLVFQSQGKYEVAEEMYRRALEARERVLGKDHPDTLWGVNSLATVLHGQGKRKVAEEMYQRTLEAREKVLGKDHRDTLMSVNNLATVLQDQGKYEVAEEMYRRALEARERVLGKDHPDTLWSVNSLATVLQGQGKYEVAEEMYRRALEVREKVLGRDHPDTLLGINNLASVLHDQGKHEVAEEMYRRALEARERVLGKDHPDTLWSVNSLATVLQGQGKYEVAEEMYRRALEVREKVLGRDHPDTLLGINNLASVLHDQGKHEVAEEMYRRALEARERVLGKDHPDTLWSVNSLATVLHGQGKHKVAEEMYRRALEARERVLGKDHPDALRSMNSLATMLQGQGKYNVAEEMLQRVLEARGKVLGEDHPDTLVSADNLGTVFLDQGKYEAAEDMHRRALRGCEKVLGDGHPNTSYTAFHLAFLLHNQKRYLEAFALYERAILGLQEALGPTHSDTLSCSGHYSDLLQEMRGLNLPYPPTDLSNLTDALHTRCSNSPPSATDYGNTQQDPTRKIPITSSSDLPDSTPTEATPQPRKTRTM